MKTTLLLALFGILSTISFGQIDITIGGENHVSGTVYTYASNTNMVEVNVEVTNTSGSPVSLRIKRVLLNPISSWIDDLCWGSTSYPLEGQCYNGIQATNPYTTAHIQTINPGDYGLLQAKIKPEDPDYGCGNYRYYIMSGSSTLDSIDVSVCKTASIEDLTTPFSITIAPNPANTFIKVKTNGVEGATIKMVDVLGNAVLKETVMGSSKTINTESFKNGVYFILVEAEGEKAINRKVIVRH